MNRATIKLTFTLQEVAPIKNALEVFDRSIRSLNLGELMYDKNIESDGLLSLVAPDGLHQIGLTRMSNDPSTGVVDRNCQIFDFKNLYIAGSSVFPTAGQAAPTLPAVALAMRLSEYISRSLSQPAVQLKGPV
jgi:choline dehydrogenase-like flavoprotein